MINKVYFISQRTTEKTRMPTEFESIILCETLPIEMDKMWMFRVISVLKKLFSKNL